MDVKKIIQDLDSTLCGLPNRQIHLRKLEWKEISEHIKKLEDENEKSRKCLIILDECPFCGGEGILIDTVSGFTPRCRACEAQIDIYYKTKELAAAAWNMRAGKGSDLLGRSR